MFLRSWQPKFELGQPTFVSVAIIVKIGEAGIDTPYYFCFPRLWSVPLGRSEI